MWGIHSEHLPLRSNLKIGARTQCTGPAVFLILPSKSEKRVSGLLSSVWRVTEATIKIWVRFIYSRSNPVCGFFFLEARQTETAALCPVSFHVHSCRAKSTSSTFSDASLLHRKQTQTATCGPRIFEYLAWWWQRTVITFL